MIIMFKKMLNSITRATMSCDSIAGDLPVAFSEYLNIENYYTMEDGNSLAGGGLYRKIAYEKKSNGIYTLGIFDGCEKYHGAYFFNFSVTIDDNNNFIVLFDGVCEAVIKSDGYSHSYLYPLIKEIDKHIKYKEFDASV